ncbi:hypothetical protein [Phocaeicola paurosaccharolyticus]|jgi:hypothetical protein|uniref:hypothetical protein n=1 Tax=Phocaeicola paurosaccharolyticus TaxID=732242 RepID=UPI002FE2268F
MKNITINNRNSMIKDTFFSWNRVQLLIKKNIRENWKAIGLRILLVYGTLAIAMIWNGYYSYKYIYSDAYNEPTASFMAPLFMWTLFIFGAISASFVMEELKNKTSKISFLMNPSTPFEKYFMKWFIYTVLFLIVFMVLFIWADSTKVLIYKIIYPGNTHIAMFNYSGLIDFSNSQSYTIFSSWNELGIAVSGYMLVQSLFILGGTIWPKGAFIKTFAAIVTIICIGMALIYYSYKDFNNVNFDSNNDDTMSIIFIAVASFFAIFDWVISYFRFKETEIINRM